MEKFLTLGKMRKTFRKTGEEFLYWCQFGRPQPLGAVTLSTYKRTFELIAKHFGDVYINDISIEHVINLKKDYIERGASLSYLNRVLTLLRLILRFTLEELQIDVLSPERIKLPPRPRRDVEFLSDGELARIFACIPMNTIHGVRLRAMLSTMLDTGMRVSEVMSLNRDSIDWEDKSAYIIGKGSKKRKVLFQDWSLWWIKQYLSLRKDDHVALFVCHQNGYRKERLQSDDARRAFKRIALQVGIPKFTPHIARKTAGTKMWNNGGDLQDVQIFLGHERIQTTQIYVGKNYERVRDVQSKTLKYAVAQDVGMVPVIRWAKDHDKCLNCGLTETRHAGRGYCYNCYMNMVNARKRAEKVGNTAT